MGEKDLQPGSVNVWFHVDLDAFFAAVEQGDNPSLKGKPVIVGAAPGHRGVVSTCSYEARKFGVHSAMPISQAYRRCPQGVYLPPRMERYMEVSRQVIAILGDFSPKVQQISVDEAFLDLTGTERLFGPPRKTGARLKAAVRGKTGLDITVGIGPNRYLAKLATNAGKPDGLLEVTEETAEAFLDRLALKDLWGIGAKTLERLTELNITGVAQLRGFAEPMIASLMGKGAAAFLHAIVRGKDPGIFSEEPRSRSLSNETTFETDRRDVKGIETVLLELSQQVMFRLREEGWKSRTVCLKLRTHDFVTTSAQKGLKHPVGTVEEMFATVKGLFHARWDGSTPIRLVGVGASGLEPVGSQGQLELFADRDDRRKKAEEAVLKIRRKMGDGAVTKGSLIKKQE